LNVDTALIFTRSVDSKMDSERRIIIETPISGKCTNTGTRSKDGRRIDCATSCIRIVLHSTDGHKHPAASQGSENGTLQQRGVMSMWSSEHLLRERTRWRC
jgi:hypothetical protein